MAYSTANFRMSGAGPANRTYLYDTTDSIATVLGSGYFSDFVSTHKGAIGDKIECRIWSGSVPAMTKAGRNGGTLTDLILLRAGSISTNAMTAIIAGATVHALLDTLVNASNITITKNSPTLYLNDTNGGTFNRFYTNEAGTHKWGRTGVAFDMQLEGASRLRVNGDVAAGADSGAGLASHTSLTNTADVSANSTGVGSIKFKGATSRDSSGFVKIYIGTTAYYVPVFSAITG